MNAKRRFSALEPFLEAVGLEKGRVRLDWIAASEGSKVAETVKSFTEAVKQLGPNPMNKSAITK